MTAPGWLADQLPRVLAEDPFLRKFMGIFEEIADGVRAEANGQENYVDPNVAPPDMVRYLGSWVDLDLPETWPEAHQRRFVREIGPEFKWRGTKRGTAAVLEALTGAEVEIDDPAKIGRGRLQPTPVEPQPVQVKLHGTGGLTNIALLKWVAAMLPATVNFDLTIDAAADGLPPATYRMRGMDVFDDNWNLRSAKNAPDLDRPTERGAQ